MKKKNEEKKKDRVKQLGNKDKEISNKISKLIKNLMNLYIKFKYNLKQTDKPVQFQSICKQKCKQKCKQSKKKVCLSFTAFSEVFTLFIYGVFLLYLHINKEFVIFLIAHN